MTDLSVDAHNVPSRLGVSLTLDDGELVGHLDPIPVVCDRGTLPASALVFLADVVAGLAVDTDPEAWTFTSDISVRAPAVPPPSSVQARSVTRRSGRRSITCEVPFTVDGRSWGVSFIAFARVPRRDGDPPKPEFDVVDAVDHWNHVPVLDEPFRSAAGIATVDSAHGVVSVDLRPELLNPAGALQGAMVSYLAEAAAEDLADHHLAGHPLADHHPIGEDSTGTHPPGEHSAGQPRPGSVPRWVVTELEVRFLAQNRSGPIVTQAEFVGSPADGLVRVDLVDEGGAGRCTTAVLARLAPAPTA